nr:hypothetical protein [Flavobacteriaceae bacterium]
MKKLIPNCLLTLLFLCGFLTPVIAQGPGSLFVDAGPDVTIDCSTATCADITATFLETFDTSGSSYTVNSIPFTPPFPFDGLANPLNPDIDDAWSDVDNLPFEFCFFGNLEDQFQVGSNGVIRFDVDASDTSNAWAFSEDLPNNTNDALGEANVFTPVHDIDPSVSGTEEIAYEVLGVFPNRVLVVSYFNVPMFSCNSLLATHMAVFYEFSNVIEIYIKDKPTCAWNGGASALGIQNNAGDTAYVPPGRNTSDGPWTTNDEAWSFEPVGPPTYVFEWLDSTGTVIGTTPTLNVCPSGTEIYTARVTWTNTCNGDVVTLTDDVVVFSNGPFVIDLGPDIETCEADDIILDAGVSAPAGTTYEWFFNGVSQGPPSTTAPTFTVTAPNPGTYSVEAIDPSDPTCPVLDSIEITFYDPLIVDNTIGPIIECDPDSDGFTEFDLTLVDPLITLGNPDYVVTYHGTLINAELNQLPLMNPYVNDSPYNDVPITDTADPGYGTGGVWARVASLTTPCTAIVPFALEVRDSPMAVTPSAPLRRCDDDGAEDGFAQFDLTVVEPEVLGGMPPL